MLGLFIWYAVCLVILGALWKLNDLYAGGFQQGGRIVLGACFLIATLYLLAGMIGMAPYPVWR